MAELDLEAITAKIVDEMPAIAPEGAFAREFRRRFAARILDEAAKVCDAAPMTYLTTSECAERIRALAPRVAGE